MTCGFFYVLGMYYGVTICLVSLATAMTVFTLNVHHKGLRGSPVPRYIKIVAFKYLARLLCIQLDPPDYIGDEEHVIFLDSLYYFSYFTCNVM